MPELSENHFQVVIIGTGLAESVAAAALSKAGFTTAHLDPNQYYGSEQASLTTDELSDWINQNKSSTTGRYTSVSGSSNIVSQSRQYAISLQPAVIPAVGSLISALVESGVSRYGGYKLLEKIAVYDSTSEAMQIVPGSKDAVFKSKKLSLVDKRRLMRFLMFAAGDFEEKPELDGKNDAPFLEYLQTAFNLPKPIAETVAFAIAFCDKATDPTLPALKRIRKNLRSTGRYGPSPFLVGHYGGAGEIAQGFCRSAAVHGGVYILGRNIKDVAVMSAAGAVGNFSIVIDDFPEQITGDIILSSPSLLPPNLMPHARQVFPDEEIFHLAPYTARAIIVLDHPIIVSQEDVLKEEGEEGQDEGNNEDATPTRHTDTAILVFPPGSVPDGSTDTSVSAYVAGENSMSTPKGKWVVYFSMPLQTLVADDSAEIRLRSYISKVLSLCASSQAEAGPVEPLFTTFFIEHHAQTTVAPLSDMDTKPDSQAHSFALVTPPILNSLTGLSDASAVAGEALFWATAKSLQAQGIAPKNRAEGDSEEVATFWPPQEKNEGADEEEW